MIVRSAQVFVLFLFFQSFASAHACMEPVRFEETSVYAQFEAIEAETTSEEEVFKKFAEESELGKALLGYHEFSSGKEFEIFNDIKQLQRKWNEGKGFIAQHLLASFVFSEMKFLRENNHIEFLEEFLTANKRFCWLATDSEIFNVLEYKLREAQAYPQELELEELVSFSRKALWHSGDEDYLQKYFELMRLGGIELVKEELEHWSEGNSSSDFCSGVAHCIERIRIEFEKAKKEIKEKKKRIGKEFDCGGMYVNSSGKSIKINLC